MPTQNNNQPPKMTIEFNNMSDSPIQVFWVASAGDERRYKTLLPGESYRQQTHPFAVWQLYQQTQVASFTAGSEVHQVYIIQAPDEAGAGERNSWLAIHLADEAGNPVAGTRYDIYQDSTLMQTGVLDQQGQVRIVGLPVGSYEVSFPEFDAHDWHKSDKVDPPLT